MRRYLAIIFSALLVVVQAIPGMGAAVAERMADAPCKCCSCGNAGCCVTESAPAPQPLAAHPGLGSLQLTEFLFLQISFSETTTSSGDPADSRAARESGCRAPAIPLFERYCSFLI
jgi:hypothetical protein